MFVQVMQGQLNNYEKLRKLEQENEARANEAKPIPEEFSKSFDDWQGLVDVKAFYDITDPWLTSA